MKINANPANCYAMPSFNLLFKKCLTLLLMITLGLSAGTVYAQSTAKYSKAELSDAALIKSLPGFKNAYAEVNGVKLHYVIGGQGEPLVLLPGWPQTWWSFHQIMPQLAAKYKVIVVDIRGMGSSGRPESGYDKKNMAKDINDLIHTLGFQKAFISGHDIGAQVAFAVAANYPEVTAKLILMDVPHPDDTFAATLMLPALGTPTDKLDENHPFLWWFAFNQMKGMPEKLLAGRVRLVQDAVFKYLLYNEAALSELDREVYAAAYDSPGGVRAGNAWYQAFPQDIADYKNYNKVTMPVLGIGGPGYNWLNYVLPNKATDVKVVKVEGSGHFVAEEKPKATADFMIDFLK
ncbi:Pimeloyl-ACP methyl ester carboxylesterase [Mucilaginibacter lappiensis]|uniref:Pimeloyl-ACP methyl ester carboxylesterase n=1 Tax=Mucilaginibacter lappiensis TaxID=354630 RepID=A0ABR6PDE7_9SPHI|nr:alpha/beta hydrolase [Mucilaginibacter lappiensis]MBB6107772.1 pimeloyl-ACP methyl ester carboxylesterase [Mucilaginibacter lappiensis]SIP97650.1 Pimeloyl-ACP methyl ester carboxylesterase [Mucilaginibacter lappiensis]